MNVMIMGAGVYQLPLIQKAKEKGFKTIVVSPKGQYPGLHVADVVIDCDTRDKSSVLEAAKKHSISAILTSGTDVAVPTIGYVVDEMKLNGTGYDAAVKSMDKISMKNAFVDGKVRTARHYTSMDLEDVKSTCTEIGFPCMIKAIDSSGSRGISKVDSLSEVEAAYKFSLSVSNSKSVIVEEYIDGLEFGAQAFISKGKVIYTCFHNDTVSAPPISVPLGHSVPINMDEIYLSDAEKQIQKAVDSLQINNTIANVDLMLSNGKIYVLEIGARIGATCLPENISIFKQFDIYSYLLDLSFGNELEDFSCLDEKPNASMLITSEKSGVVKSIYIPDEVKYSPFLEQLRLDIKVGDIVREFKVGSDRIGHIITSGNSAQNAETRCLKLLNKIEIEVC